MDQTQSGPPPSTSFSGHGIQHTGSGNLTVKGDVNISSGVGQDDALLSDLRPTDPRDDRIRIERDKGGLLVESYQWILTHKDFQQWRDDDQKRLLWIKGDPGKGKTMLLCGIINELTRWYAKSTNISYFFFQATDQRINSATAAIRGLLYLLITQQPHLSSHLKERYKHAGKSLFEDVNSWDSLCGILYNILHDPALRESFLIIDALDECRGHLDLLLDLLVSVCSYSKVRVLVSSRNWPTIEGALEQATHKVRLCLELNDESISSAVSLYIEFKVKKLATEKKYDEAVAKQVYQHLSSKADGTFLWVSLVCKALGSFKIPRWKAIEVLNAYPAGLVPLYQRMSEDMFSSDESDLCRQVLAVASMVYHPIGLVELANLVENPDDFPKDAEALRDIVGLCGSFLALRDEVVYFVHQSAKDFLMEKLHGSILPLGTHHQHWSIFSRSLDCLKANLQRDIYQLGSLETLAADVRAPDPDPLGPIRYSCVFWVDHLRDARRSNLYEVVCDARLQSGGDVYEFLTSKFLSWLEGLSLLGKMSEGIMAVKKLEALVTDKKGQMGRLLYDASRFIMFNRAAIELAPLQAYNSAIIFSPTNSIIRQTFEDKQAHGWILKKPTVETEWSPCLQTLEGHEDEIYCMAFSMDNKYLASGSRDGAIKTWDISTGACLHTMHTSNFLHGLEFSTTGTHLISNSEVVEIWDTRTGECLKTFPSDVVCAKFLPDGLLTSVNYPAIDIWSADGLHLKTRQLHSAPEGNLELCNVHFSVDTKYLVVYFNNDSTIHVWDTATGGRLTQPECALSGPGGIVSPDGTRLISKLQSNGIHIWDLKSRKCLHLHEGCEHLDLSDVALSSDSSRLATRSRARRGIESIKVWDTSTGECLHSFEANFPRRCFMKFLSDGTQLASGANNIVNIWDLKSGTRLNTLQVSSHKSLIEFSPNAAWLVTGSQNGSIRIWDATASTSTRVPERYETRVREVLISANGATIVLMFGDNPSRPPYSLVAWDTTTDSCLEALSAKDIFSAALSWDSRWLVSVGEKQGCVVQETATGRILKELGLSLSQAMAFSRDGTRLAGGSNLHVEIYHVATDMRSFLCNVSNLHLIQLEALAFSLDDSLLITIYGHGGIFIWEVSTGAMLKRIEGSDAYLAWNGVNQSQLHTDVGIFGLQVPMIHPFEKQKIPLYETRSAIKKKSSPEFSISADGKWILRRTEPILWLPPEYRARQSTIYGNVLCWISQSTSRLYWLKVNLE